MNADLLYPAGTAVVLALLALVVIRTDPRTRVVKLPTETALSAEIDRRAEVLRESRDEGARTIVELHARGQRLSASIARRGLR
jgi:hypothetical protein